VDIHGWSACGELAPLRRDGMMWSGPSIPGEDPLVQFRLDLGASRTPGDGCAVTARRLVVARPAASSAGDRPPAGLRAQWQPGGWAWQAVVAVWRTRETAVVGTPAVGRSGCCPRGVRIPPSSAVAPAVPDPAGRERARRRAACRPGVLSTRRSGIWPSHPAGPVRGEARRVESRRCAAPYRIVP